MPLNYWRIPSVGRADPSIIPVAHEIPPNQYFEFFYKHLLCVVAVIEQLRFHPSPHAPTAGIIMATTASTVHALKNLMLGNSIMYC